MRRATFQMRKFSRALLALDANGEKPGTTGRPAALGIFEKLRPHMAGLMGSHGFHAILARSLSLATAEVPWLFGLRLLPSGAWEVRAQLEAKITPEQSAEGNEVLVAHVLGLLVALMGEHVTLRQLHEVWSKLSLDQGDEDNSLKT